MQLLVGFAVLLQTLLLLQLHGCQGTNDIILSDVQVENNDDTPIQENLLGDTEPFIPTHEWQVVKPNQAIPAGLHVRMNFQTGIKEAKILEDDESKLQVNSNEESTGPKIVLGEEIKKDVNQFSENEDKIYFTKQHLKEALSEFRDKVGTKDVDDVTWSTDAKKAMEEEIANAERVKKKFRSIEEIKAELEDSMKMKMKPDVDVMKEILHYIMAKNSTVKEIGAALDNLEYYVHQFDNALDLDKIGGLEAVVQLLNHTNEDVSAKAANVIGAASQNNKEIELAVLHYGGLRLLLQMLQKEKKALTKKKSIFALSAIVRQNPNALADFIKLNGVANTLNVIQDKSLATSLHVKAIDFLFDLVEEQNLILRKVKESNKTAVEEQPLLLNILVKSGLCDILFPILNTEDFYTKEKIMHAIKLSVDACKHTFKQRENVKVLEKELLVLMQKIKEEDDADFKEYLVNLKVQLEKDIIKKLKN